MKDETYPQIIIRLTKDVIRDKHDKVSVINKEAEALKEKALKEIKKVNEENLKNEITPEIKEKFCLHFASKLEKENILISNLDCDSTETKYQVDNYILYQLRLSGRSSFHYLIKNDVKIKITRSEYDKFVSIIMKKRIQKELKTIE